MMSLKPRFSRVTVAGRAELRLGYSEEANKLIKTPQTADPSYISKKPGEVEAKAKSEVTRLGGNPSKRTDLLGQFELQFGRFRGKTFKWLLENGLGYAAWIVNSMSSETATSSPLSVNKHSFAEYFKSFPEGREALALKKEKAKEQTASSTSTSSSSTRQTSTRTSGTTAVASLVGRSSLSPQEIAKRLHRTIQGKSVKATFPTDTPLRIPEDMNSVSDELLLSAANAIDSSPVVPKTAPKPQTEEKQVGASKDYPLPEGWKKSLPKQDHIWVSKALFKQSTMKDKAELDMAKINKLWWYPPQPSLRVHQRPTVNTYFTRRLLLWMPRKLWQVLLLCPHDDCVKHPLTSAGLYPHVRQVLDLDGFYSLATEYLECGKCKRKVISWSQGILDQLDVGHRKQFPIIITYNYACDMRVVRLLRQRGFGNSSTQLQKKLTEQHREQWLQRTAHYLTDCQTFVEASKRQLVLAPELDEPPSLPTLPKAGWLLTVYCRDVLSRLEEVKAYITSTFGSVLKIDSTKKVTKKLAGAAAGTAAWVTNIGNEFGQVLNSVLTASEGSGLRPMATGIIRRYEVAGVSPPVLLYTDRDCCGEKKVSSLFTTWHELNVRLDAWHFMRRFAAGCTTDSHPLYGTFMARLSQCIFEWSGEDLNLLKRAKAAQLAKSSVQNPSDEDIMQHITKKELSLHVRRKTRGIQVTTILISNLLEAFSGPQGNDTLGVPLLDCDRIWTIWESQQKHIACIQDPEGVQLYTKTGTIVKGGIDLPVYRCSRGSTSLESFHNHLDFFIPGTSANDLHFHAFLLEGVARWNRDREVAAVTEANSAPTYDSALTSAVNKLSENVLGKKLFANFRGPNKYTGELIGVEYLYAQTGQVLQKASSDEDNETSVQVPDGDDEDEGFQDVTTDSEDPTVAYTGDHPVPEIVTEPTGDSGEDDSVGPRNIPGYDRVTALADFLVNLRDCNGALSNQEASQLVALWKNMSEYDRKPITFNPRHQPQLTQGRFKAAKKSTVVPGASSTKRCFLGQNSGPASWPDCNRYMEAVIIKLTHIFPSPVRRGGNTTLRWTLIGNAYKKIREAVLNNAYVMQQTGIQLAEINQRTLIQWYNKRSRKQEEDVLKQGINLPAPVASTNTTLPQPRERPESLNTGVNQEKHTFDLPVNTAGQASVRRVIRPSVLPKLPQLPSANVMVVSPSGPVTATPVAIAVPAVPIPASTQSYRKRKEEEAKASAVPLKKYRPRTGASQCSKCQKDRTSATGHHQYFGNWFCPQTATETYEAWRARLQTEKQYKKKK